MKKLISLMLLCFCVSVSAQDLLQERSLNLVWKLYLNKSQFYICSQKRDSNLMTQCIHIKQYRDMECKVVTPQEGYIRCPIES